MRNKSLVLALLAGGVLTLGVAAASAQDYDRHDDNGYRNNSENLEVTVPRYREHDRMGTTYKNVSLSKEVFFNDLDLRTNRGARILKSRIQLTARLLCKDLDDRYPVTADDSPPCYRNAIEDAMYQADMAIDSARSYSD